GKSSIRDSTRRSACFATSSGSRRNGPICTRCARWPARRRSRGSPSRCCRMLLQPRSSTNPGPRSFCRPRTPTASHLPTPRLRHKVRNNPLSDCTPRRAAQLNLLSKLASRVDPEFKPFARRGERANAEGSVDAIIGFTKISGFFRDDEMTSFIDRKRGPSTFGDTIEIATFGRMRNETARINEMAQRRLANYTAPGGSWNIRDLSQTGFRLIAPMSVINAVTLGTLAAIRTQSDAHGHWTLGIVRRMKRLTTERAEIGLQVIADNLAGVEL